MPDIFSFSVNLKAVPNSSDCSQWKRKRKNKKKRNISQLPQKHSSNSIPVPDPFNVRITVNTIWGVRFLKHQKVNLGAAAEACLISQGLTLIFTPSVRTKDDLSQKIKNKKTSIEYFVLYKDLRLPNKFVPLYWKSYIIFQAYFWPYIKGKVVRSQKKTQSTGRHIGTSVCAAAPTQRTRHQSSQSFDCGMSIKPKYRLLWRLAEIFETWLNCTSENGISPFFFHWSRMASSSFQHSSLSFYSTFVSLRWSVKPAGKLSKPHCAALVWIWGLGWGIGQCCKLSDAWIYRLHLCQCENVRGHLNYLLGPRGLFWSPCLKITHLNWVEYPAVSNSVRIMLVSKYSLICELKLI